MLADIFFLDALDVGHLFLQPLKLFLPLVIQSCLLPCLQTLNLSLKRACVLAQGACLVGLLFALAVAFCLALDGCFACSLHGIC